MIMKINEFIQKYRSVKEYSDDSLPPFNSINSSIQPPTMKRTHNPRVMCKDGFTMSVQAGQSCYSVPNDVVDEYAEVEIGFPSIPEPLIEQYAEIMDVESSEDDAWLCDTVYPYVPINTIDEVIQKHGGIDEGAVWDAMTESQKLTSGTYKIVNM
jgi:hypothetical protein